MTDLDSETQPISAAACADGTILVIQPGQQSNLMRHLVVHPKQTSQLIDELLIAYESIVDNCLHGEAE